MLYVWLNRRGLKWNEGYNGFGRIFRGWVVNNIPYRRRSYSVFRLAMAAFAQCIQSIRATGPDFSQTVLVVRRRIAQPAAAIRYAETHPLVRRVIKSEKYSVLQNHCGFFRFLVGVEEVFSD